jgi:phosphoribosylanthranilate isomerase
MRTRVKICGLTRRADVEAAVAAGVDALGFVFHPSSPRAVSPEDARDLCAGLPPFVTAVGLFVDASPEQIRSTLDRVPLELLQFHGEEAPELCASFGRRWIKAIRMRPGLNLAEERRRYAQAAGLLLDTFDPARAGGTGQRFDWDRIPAALGTFDRPRRRSGCRTMSGGDPSGSTVRGRCERRRRGVQGRQGP